MNATTQLTHAGRTADGPRSIRRQSVPRFWGLASYSDFAPSFEGAISPHVDCETLMLQPQPRCSMVRTDPYDVDFRLGQLGMTRSWLWTAMERAAVAHRLAPPFGFDGNAAYYAADRALSELCLAPLEAGWHRNSFLRIPVAMNRAQTIAVGVTSGDVNTGLNADDDPRTTTIKGPATTLIAGQFDFSRTDDDINGVDYWIALGHWTEDEMRCELSRPLAPDPDGRLSGWAERVIIERPGTAPSGPRRRGRDFAQQKPPLVRRRAA